jgi:hypothetical protein
MAIDPVMTANESPKCTTVKKFESCARDYRNRFRSRRILRQNPSDQTPCSELDRALKRCGMDIRHGHGLPYDFRRVVAGAPVCSVASPVAVTGARNFLYAYFSIIQICRHTLVSRRSLPQVQNANSFRTRSQRRTGSVRRPSKALADLRTTRMPPSGGLQ